MKKTLARSIVLTPQKKAAAKANVLKSALTSLKIEGVTLSPQRIKSIRSRLHLSK